MKTIRCYLNKVNEVLKNNNWSESLIEGENLIQFKKKASKTCTLNVSFKIVVPKNQQANNQVCFVLTDTFTVSGRGHVSYGFEIIQNLDETLGECEYSEDIFKNNTSIIGFDEEFNSVFLNLKQVIFTNENIFRQNEDTFKISSVENHYIYGQNSKLKMLYENSIYNFSGFLEDFIPDTKINNSNYKFFNFYNKIDTIYTKNINLIIDAKKRVWSKDVEFSIKDLNDIQSKVKIYSKYMFIAHNDYLYILTNPFNLSEKNKDVIYFSGRFYSKVQPIEKNIKADIAPLFKTNIETISYPSGKGVYSKCCIDNVEYVVAHICISFNSPSTIKSKVVIINNNLYVIAGEYKKVGILISRNCNWNGIYIGENFAENKMHFFESFEDKNLSEIFKRNQKELSLYDKSLGERSFEFEIGDTAEVIKEITHKSNLKGLKGKVINISYNKKKITLEFFGHFNEEFDISYIRKNE